MTSKRRAIGFVRQEHSGSRVNWDDRDIGHYAYAAGLELVRVLITPENAVDPIRLLLKAADDARAEVVIVPSLAHVDTAKRAVTELLALHIVDSGSTYKRGHRWPSTILPGEVNSNGTAQPRPGR